MEVHGQQSLENIALESRHYIFFEVRDYVILFNQLYWSIASTQKSAQVSVQPGE